MEGAAHRSERLAIERVLFPILKIPSDLLQLLASLLDEEFEKLRIDRVCEGDACRLARGQDRQHRVSARQNHVRRAGLLACAPQLHRACK